MKYDIKSTQHVPTDAMWDQMSCILEAASSR